jgi:hypothetical protein
MWWRDGWGAFVVSEGWCDGGGGGVEMKVWQDYSKTEKKKHIRKHN